MEDGNLIFQLNVVCWEFHGLLTCHIQMLWGFYSQVLSGLGLSPSPWSLPRHKAASFSNAPFSWLLDGFRQRKMPAMEVWREGDETRPTHYPPLSFQKVLGFSSALNFPWTWFQTALRFPVGCSTALLLCSSPLTWGWRWLLQLFTSTVPLSPLPLPST